MRLNQSLAHAIGTFSAGSFNDFQFQFVVLCFLLLLSHFKMLFGRN